MRERTLSWLALVLAGVAILLALRRPSAATETHQEDTLSRIQTQKRLRVGYITYPPTAFRDPVSGQMRGHFVDTIQEMMRQLDPSIQIEYKETTWADFTTALNTHDIDLSIAGTFTTIPRARRVTFTRPLVYLARSAIIRRGDTRFTADAGPLQFDRPGIRVGVVDGEGSHEFVKANFKNLSNLVVFSGADLSQCLAAVSAGQVDVGMSDAMETERYAKAHPEVVDLFAEHPYDITPVAWAVRHDDLVWKNFLDTAIATFESQGKLAAFERAYDYRWLHPVVQFNRQ
jgi:polar amino acid transport system substrate-binding protein